MTAYQYTALEVFTYDNDDAAGNVRLITKPKPTLGQGEVLVHVTLRPVNPSDVMSSQGIYPGFVATKDDPSKLPGVPGLDGVGVVVALGPGVSGFKEGQRVSALGWPADQGGGSWQEYVVAPAELLVEMPDGLSDEAAAQYYVNPFTVVGLVDVTSVPKDKYLLITAAGSALGRMLISVAKHEGVHAIGIVRRDEHKAELKALGAYEVINSTSEDVVQRVLEVTGGERAWAAVDAVAGEQVKMVAKCVRNSGHVFVYGALAGTDVHIDLPDLFFRDVHLNGFWLGPWLFSKRPEELHVVTEHVKDLMLKNVITAEAGNVFKLSEYRAAIEESIKPGHKGKVMMRND